MNTTCIDPFDFRDGFSIRLAPSRGGNPNMLDPAHPSFPKHALAALFDPDDEVLLGQVWGILRSLPFEPAAFAKDRCVFMGASMSEDRMGVTPIDYVKDDYGCYWLVVLPLGMTQSQAISLIPFAIARAWCGELEPMLLDDELEREATAMAASWRSIAQDGLEN